MGNNATKKTVCDEELNTFTKLSKVRGWGQTVVGEEHFQLQYKISGFSSILVYQVF